MQLHSPVLLISFAICYLSPPPVLFLFTIRVFSVPFPPPKGPVLFNLCWLYSYVGLIAILLFHEVHVVCLLTYFIYH